MNEQIGVRSASLLLIVSHSAQAMVSLPTDSRLI